MIDTHSHIYSEEFDADRETVILEAQSFGVERIIMANVDSSSIDRLDETHRKYPHFCCSAMGLHPTSVKEDYKKELDIIKNQLSTNKYIAVGEIGIDLYWDSTFLEEQKIAFKTQLEWAKEKDLPVIIHIRKSFSEVFQILKIFGKKAHRGVFHCFSGGIQEAKYAVELGFLLGIGGVITYKKNTLQEFINSINIDKILLETDSPYLSPTPHRGKRNEPKFMIETLKKLSLIYKIPEEKIDDITTSSAKKLFNI